MPVPIYRRWDADGETRTLTGEVGSLYNLWKSVLAEAGWTVAFDDPVNYQVVFQNDAITGSGCYVRLNDNGPTNAGWAKVVVYENMSDIDTGTGPHVLEENSYIKKSNTTNTTTRPWIIVADNRTMWFWCNAGGTNDFTLICVGDYESFVPGLPGCLQTPTASASSSRLQSWCVRGGSNPVRISRNPQTSDIEINEATYYWSTGSTVTGDSGFGRSGETAKPSYVASLQWLPLHIREASKYIIGKMRGSLGTVYANPDDSGVEYTNTDGIELYTCVNLVAGVANNSSLLGALSIIVDRDWDESL